MKLSTREDVFAPRDVVFAAMTDFDRIEALMADRGVAITTTRSGPASEGTTWTADYDLRGRKFRTEATLIALEPDAAYRVESLTGGVICDASVDLLAISETRTRIFAALEFRPTTLSSRLLLQSLKLAKPRLSEKFAASIARFAARIQDDFAASGNA